jgi:uncharacterized membrane protein YgcG
MGKWVRFLVLVTMLSLFFAIDQAIAVAKPPFQLTDSVASQSALFDAQGDPRIKASIEDLRKTGISLSVVYVDDFSGMGGKEWADRTSLLSKIGANDVLLAIALRERRYGISVDDRFPMSDSTISMIENEKLRPLLSRNDWGGAAVAMASGLRDAVSATSSTTASNEPSTNDNAWYALGILGTILFIFLLIKLNSGDGPYPPVGGYGPS